MRKQNYSIALFVCLFLSFQLSISQTKSTPTKTTIPHPDLNLNDTGIKIFSDTDLHLTSSYILGTVRNHVEKPYKNSDYTEDYKPILLKYGEIKPTFGAGKKMYRLGHGITDGREDYDYINGYHFEKHWNARGPYPYDDIRIGLNEAKLADSDVIMVVNYGSADANEAGKLVSFLNKKENSLRNQYPNNEGNDNPYHVKYFEIGNEITWDQETGHNTYAKTPEQYATRAKTFATKMRANSDIPIKIGVVGATNSNWTATDWGGPTLSDHRVPHLNPLIDIMGSDLDFIIFHNYSKWPFDELDNLQSMSQAQFSKDLINDWVLPTIREGEVRNSLPAHSIKLANTEFHSENGNWSDEREIGQAVEFLYSAGEIINAITIQDLTIATNFCISHNKVAVDNLFFYDYLDPNTPTGVYALQKMIAENLGDIVVETKGYNLPIHTYTAGKFDNNGHNSLEMYGYKKGVFNLEKLAFATTKRSDGSLALLILNKMENENISIPIDPGFEVGSATLQTLKGKSYTDTNYEITDPLPITDLGNVTLPATSVSILIINPENSLSVDSENDNFKIFPIPTKDYLTINSKNKLKQVVIYNSIGEVLQIINENLNQVDLSNLSDGVYFLKITDTTEHTFFKKVIKKSF